MFLYETDDQEFAESALEALRAAGIDCYRTGGALPPGTLHYGWCDTTLCLHIRRHTDYLKASSVLIELGADLGQRPKLPSAWTMVLIALTAAVLAFYFAYYWP